MPTASWPGSSASASDITLAKEAELELRRQVDERTAQLALSEAQFRAIFEAVLEVIVLLEPDGTFIEMNRPKADLARTRTDAGRSGQKLWDAPTLKAYPQHVALMKNGIAKAARRRGVPAEVRMEREGVPTALSRLVGAAGARRRRARSSICCSKRATSPS